MLISQIEIGERHRKDAGDIAALAQSIADVGLLQPVVVRTDNRLVAGARRIAAFQQLGRTEIPVIVATNLDQAVRLLRAERDENTCRKNFSISESVRHGESLEELERFLAKERQRERTGNQPGAKSGKLPDLPPVRDAVGDAVGMSGKTYEKAREVLHAAETDPWKFGKLAEAMDRTPPALHTQSSIS